MRRVTPDSRSPETTVYELPEAPEGFDHAGRFALTPASPVTEGLVPGGGRVIGIIDVWTRGADFVAVFNGGAGRQSRSADQLWSEVRLQERQA